MPIKTFVNGYPLPASEVNTYLMNQAVMTFASAIARTSAITTPVKGMVTWLDDVNKYQYYTGSAWADLIPDTSAMVTLTGTQTLTNKTLNGDVLNYPIEGWNIAATAFAGYTAYLQTSVSGVHYLTTNATANGTLNISWASATTLNSVLAVGQAITLNLLITNGATPYFVSAIQVDGTATGVTTKWSGGTAASTGNASSVDAYSFTLIKTAAATWTVLAAGAIKYA